MDTIKDEKSNSTESKDIELVISGSSWGFLIILIICLTLIIFGAGMLFERYLDSYDLTSAQLTTEELEVEPTTDDGVIAPEENEKKDGVGSCKVEA